MINKAPQDFNPAGLFTNKSELILVLIVEGAAAEVAGPAAPAHYTGAALFHEIGLFLGDSAIGDRFIEFLGAEVGHQFAEIFSSHALFGGEGVHAVAGCKAGVDFIDRHTKFIGEGLDHIVVHFTVVGETGAHHAAAAKPAHHSPPIIGSGNWGFHGLGKDIASVAKSESHRGN